MYCVLVTGIPASGKSTIAEFLSNRFDIILLSKDKIKEIMFDDIGFKSRDEKVKLGIASMNIMYECAEQLMKHKLPFILENNFENNSKAGLMAILEKYSYTAVTVLMTGDYEKVYKRFLKRNESPDRHRGHVVNNCYPETEGEHGSASVPSYENFVKGISERGMDRFKANGPCLVLDTTDFSTINREDLIRKIDACRRQILGGS